MMATTADYLNKLVSQKNALADNLTNMGVESTHDETLETLIPKVLEISSGGNGIYPVGVDSRPTGDVIVPEGVTSLYQYIFYDNANVTSVKLPATLTQISSSAFQSCKALTNLVFPNGVSEIPSNCCNDCGSLKSVTLPKSLTTIGGYVFNKCSNLANIVIPEDIGFLKAGSYAFYGTLLDNAAITSLATKINSTGSWMFANSKNLTEVTTCITYDYYFSDCTNLKKATILFPLSSGGMGDYVFRNCSNLETIILPDGLKIIGSSAFSGCTNLPIIDIPNSVTTIDYYAFDKCSSLCNLNIPDGASFSVKNYAFQSSGITNDGVNNIMAHATSFGEAVFASCLSLTDISVNKTSNGMFRDCTNLVSAVLSDITTINRYVFQGCTALKTVFLPSTITSDSNNCLTSNSSSYYIFYGCTALEDVKLGQDWNMSLRLNVSNNITVESMVAMFNSLKDLTGDTAKTLTLGSTNLAKLTDEQKAIATNKNWTLA